MMIFSVQGENLKNPWDFIPNNLIKTHNNYMNVYLTEVKMTAI